MTNYAGNAGTKVSTRMYQKGCRHENGYWKADSKDPSIQVHQCASCHANDRALNMANKVAKDLGLPP